MLFLKKSPVFNLIAKTFFWKVPCIQYRNLFRHLSLVPCLFRKILKKSVSDIFLWLQPVAYDCDLSLNLHKVLSWYLFWNPSLWEYLFSSLFSNLAILSSNLAFLKWFNGINPNFAISGKPSGFFSRISLIFY